MKSKLIAVSLAMMVAGGASAFADDPHLDVHSFRPVSASKVVPPSVQTPPEHVVTIDAKCGADEIALCNGFQSIPQNGNLSYGFYAAHILKYKPIMDADGDAAVGCRLIEYSRAVQNTIASVWAMCVSVTGKDRN